MQEAFFYMVSQLDNIGATRYNQYTISLKLNFLLEKRLFYFATMA